MLIKATRIDDEVHVSIKYNPIKVEVERAEETASVSVVELTDNININSKNINSAVMMSIGKITEDFNISVENNNKLNIWCGLVCTLPELKLFLEISPELIFLTQYNNYSNDVYVISNVVWNIT